MTTAAQKPMSHKRVARSRISAFGASSGAGKANRGAGPARPKRYRRKLEDATASTRGRLCRAGRVTRPLLGADMGDARRFRGGRSRRHVIRHARRDWLCVAKGLAGVAGAAWAVLFYAPTALFARLLKSARHTFS